MKKHIILILFGILAFQMSAKAQEDEEYKTIYREKIARFTNMKNAGIGLTIGGAVLTVFGITSISESINMMNNSNSTSSDNAAVAKYLTGMICTELGIVMTAGGITFWTIGASKRNKYIRKLNSVSLKLDPNPSRALSFVYQF